mgnify:CR=1 FL=1
MRELPSIREAVGEKAKAHTTPPSPAATAPLTRGAWNAKKLIFALSLPFAKQPADFCRLPLTRELPSIREAVGEKAKRTHPSVACGNSSPDMGSLERKKIDFCPLGPFCQTTDIFSFSRLPLMRELPSFSEAEGEKTMFLGHIVLRYW